MITKITEEMVKENPVGIPEILTKNVLSALGATCVEDIKVSDVLAKINRMRKKRAMWQDQISAISKATRPARDAASDNDYLKKTKARASTYSIRNCIELYNSIAESLSGFDALEPELKEQHLAVSKQLNHIAITLQLMPAEGLLKCADDVIALIKPTEELRQKAIDIVFGSAKSLLKKEEAAIRIRKKFDERIESSTKLLKEAMWCVREGSQYLKAVYGNESEEMRLELGRALTAEAKEITAILTALKELEPDCFGLKMVAEASKTFLSAAMYFSRTYQVTFTTRHGRVVSYLKDDKSSHKYQRGQCPKHVKNEAGEYVYMLNPVAMDNFLGMNNIPDEEIYVTEDSLDCFYGFEKGDGYRFAPSLTKAFINEWSNGDCPDLKRFTPNKHQDTNMMGMTIVMFTNTLTEIGWQQSYFDNSITEKEIKTIIKHLDYPEGRVTKELKNLLTAQKIDEEEAQSIETFIKEYDEKIQVIFYENEELAWDALKTRFPDRYSEVDGEKKFDDNFGFDCGFIHFTASDKEYKTKREILRNSKKNSEYCSANMNLRLPMFFQSVTAQSVAAQALVNIANQQLGCNISYYTVLD